MSNGVKWAVLVPVLVGLLTLSVGAGGWMLVEHTKLPHKDAVHQETMKTVISLLRDDLNDIKLDIREIRNRLEARQ